MSDKISCPSCKEEISKDATKCFHCHEFVNTPQKNPPEIADHTQFKAICELLGKMILPSTIFIIILVFQPTFEDLLKNTKSAKFLGVSIFFSESSGFQGDLTPMALYHLIGSASRGGTRYEDERKTYIDELVKKGLVTVEVDIKNEGSPEMQGTWAILNPTPQGTILLNNMGVSVKNRITN